MLHTNQIPSKWWGLLGKASVAITLSTCQALNSTTYNWHQAQGQIIPSY